MRKLYPILIFPLVLITGSSGQFFKIGPDKTVPLNIPHAPSVGLLVKRVAFGQPGGSCPAEASDLVDRIIMPDLRRNDIQVIERQALDQIMAEHNFNQSVYADPTSAAKLGKILGPSALIIVNVSGCHSEQQPLVNDQRNLNNGITRTFISKSRYSLEGSIRVVDLTTGQVLGSSEFEAKPEKENTSQSGQPEFPPIDEVKDSAFKLAGRQINAVFFPYAETAMETFYDDRDCGLKEIYEDYQRGDRDGVLKLADNSVEQCASAHKKDKSLSRAYYDAGLLYCANKDFGKAAQLFSQAMTGKGAEAAAKTAADCERAKGGQVAAEAYTAKLSQIPAPLPFATPRSEENPIVTKAAQKTSEDGGKAAAQGSAEERLKKLDRLLKQGLITKNEYDQKRTAILNEL